MFAVHSTGVLIVVGGPQYRAGSHRHFVELARALAERGWPTLRFDVRGMGDSDGAPQGFEQIAPDIGAAINTLCQEVPAVQRVVLWGLCDAASAALLYVDEVTDPRVGGLVLLNPWVRTPQTYARAQVRHYYARRFWSGDLWRSLLRGQVRLASIGDFVEACFRTLRRQAATSKAADALPFQARMARGWLRFGGPSMLVLSGRDLTAREFVERVQADPGLARACARTTVTTQPMPGADHTLSHSAESAAHLGHLCAWLDGQLDNSVHATEAAEQTTDRSLL